MTTTRDTLDNPVRQDGDEDCRCIKEFDRLHPGHWMRAYPSTIAMECGRCDGHGWMARCWRCDRAATPGRKGHWEPHQCWDCTNAVHALTVGRA